MDYQVNTIRKVKRPVFADPITFIIVTQLQSTIKVLGIRLGLIYMKLTVTRNICPDFVR